MIGSPLNALNESTSRPHSLGATLGRLGRYFLPYWHVLIIVALLLIGSTWTQVLAPNLTGQAVDCFLSPAVASQASSEGASAAAATDTEATESCWFASLPSTATTADYMAGLLRLVLVLCGLYLLGALMTGIMAFLMGWAGQRVLRQLQVEMFANLERLSLAYYGQHSAGDLMSRVTNDTSAVQQAISFGLVQVLSGGLLILWIAFVMLRTNWLYGIISLAVVPMMAIATVWLSSRARREFRVTRQEIGAVNTGLMEDFAEVRTIQAFSHEDATVAAFRATNAANRDANVRADVYTFAVSPTLQALGYIGLGIVAGVGGLMLLSGQSIGGSVVTIGLIVTFVGYAQRYSQPIQQIGVLWATIQSAVAGAERIFELLDAVPDIVDKPDAKELPPVKGRIVYEGVGAEYKPGVPVLKDVSLTIEPGESFAIVGPTGAGKSTLANLIPRFYDVSAGAVTIDGNDVRDVTAASLRHQVGIVLQDIILFADTVMNNIRFGKPDATDDEVIAIAKLMQADDFIQRLPNGYQTVLGEGGGGLSQGQQQLLTIARAALTDPRILILDEATSSVDTRTEQLIQTALAKLMEGRTTIAIAHRLSTIRNVNNVLVLANGGIAEQGSHEELLAQKGMYYDLYMSQFSDQEEPPQ